MSDIEKILEKHKGGKREGLDIKTNNRVWGQLYIDHDGSLAKDLTTLIEKKVKEVAEITENTSDGYHTFKELYEFRKLYNAGLFNEWSKQGLFNVHKSWKHSDGKDCFGGGWFVVQATLPTGQITNHYEAKDWALFKCEQRSTADEWDGHTAEDVAKRLEQYLLETRKEKK